MDVTALVGPGSYSDGAKALSRLGRSGEAIVQELHGRFYEIAKRGHLYHASTAVTGVAPGTALGTTAAFALYNPAGSGKDLVILQGSMAYVSGTLGAGVVDWIATTSPLAAATTGTAITVVPGLISGQAGVGKPFTTATIPSGPTPIRPFCSLGASLASTAVQPWQVVDNVDGAIVVPPGCTVSLHATAAGGSTPLVVFGCTWEEVAV